MSAARKVRSVFLVTVSTVVLSGCPSESPPTNPPSPPFDQPPAKAPRDPASAPVAGATSAGAPGSGVATPAAVATATVQTSNEYDHPHYNPPPPPSETSHRLNAEDQGRLVYSDGHGACYVDGERTPVTVPCSEVMKRDVWKYCAGGMLEMADDASWCSCEYRGNPPRVTPRYDCKKGP